jgi:DNA-binding response OmpR family regulator
VIKFQKAIGDKIKREGWETVVASNGEEGLRIAKEKKPDLILLDIIMPVMDGITMLEKLRKTDNTPVLILTNLYDERKLKRAIKAKSHDYLIKTNYSLNQVITKIKKILHNA